MAVYKVPLDIEAEDKLIGPFSFKQFIFLLIGALFAFFTFLAFQANVVLTIFPLPFAIIFLSLGGIQRKDQPVDVYLMALARFYLKPRKRIWSPEGHVERVHITVPKLEEHVYTDNLSRREVASRLSSLAQNLDTRGWASKDVGPQQFGNMVMQNAAPQSDRLVDNPTYTANNKLDIELDITDNEDVLDTNNTQLAQEFEQRIAASEQRARQQALEAMRRQDQSDASATEVDDSAAPTPHYNPYGDMHQKVIRPLSEEPEPQPQPQPQEPQQSPETAVTQQSSADILNLSQNSDLDVATLARQAEKAQQEKKLEDDKEISLH